jgi:ABC-2 type transport system permease protein
MSAATVTRPDWSPRDGSAEPPRRPSVLRLTGLEMRKMVDTRAGFWLLMIIGLGSLAVVAIQLIWGGDGGGSLQDYFEFALLPVGILLPVLGILTVTSEWTQRTALTTFTLVPERHRIVIAKFTAAVVFAVLSVIITLLVSAVGTVLSGILDRGQGTWNLSMSMLGQAVLLQVLNVVMGVAFGMLLMNTPVAIVLFFMLPTVWSILTAQIDAIRDAAEWLNLNGAMAPLADGSMSGDEWAKLATSSVVWIVVPMVLGTLRLLRREVK